jgi:ferredoxin
MGQSIDIYQKLAQHLDKLPNGFPPTEQGVELKILHYLFTPEEAKLAICLRLVLETAAVIAQRAGQPVAEVAPKLEVMSRKGLIFSIESQNRPPVYMAAQFVPGILEYNVNNLTPQFVRDVEAYMPKLGESFFGILPSLRTIPIGRSLSATAEILPYESAEELIRCQKVILVAPCICRREHQIKGGGCGKLDEACLVFGWGAEYYQRNQLGRMISQDEAIAILQRAEEEGLVVQPSNTQDIVNICLCCGDCCQILLNLKRLSAPASAVVSPFIVNLDQDACIGCGLCVERCQMEALTLDKDKVVLAVERCIGCGLCVTTCSGEALSLKRKPEQPQVPKDINEAMTIKAKNRAELQSKIARHCL